MLSALVFLSGSCSARSIILPQECSPKLVYGEIDYNGTYEVQEGRQLGRVVYYVPVGASTLQQCATLCELEEGFVAASWDRHIPKPDAVYACYLNIQGSWTEADTYPWTDSQILQLVENSCGKGVAESAPFPCKAGRVKSDSTYGCEYDVRCDYEVTDRGLYLPTFHNNFERCLAVCDETPYCHATSFYRGGDCISALTLDEHWINASKHQYSYAVAAQMSEGSCDMPFASSEDGGIWEEL